MHASRPVSPGPGTLWYIAVLVRNGPYSISASPKDRTVLSGWCRRSRRGYPVHLISYIDRKYITHKLSSIDHSNLFNCSASSFDSFPPPVKASTRLLMESLKHSLTSFWVHRWICSSLVQRG